MHPYDADYLSRFTTRCIRALGVASIWALQRLLTADLSWASGCSGTECPAYVFAAIAAGMVEVDADLSGSFVHCFSAEMDEAKRNFITQVHGLDHVIFADLFDVSRPRAQDTVSGRWLTLPDFLGLGILIVGFSCKGASTLNTAMLARTDVHNIIDEMVSSTGLTFWATLLAVDRLRPKAFLLENVMGLLRNGAAESVAVALRAKGYVVALLQLQPTYFGFPNTRPRLFFLGIRRDLCGLHPEAEVEQKLVDLVWKQAERQVVLTIDEVILSEEEPIIADMRQQMVEKLHAPTKASKKEITQAKWPSKHKRRKLVSASCKWQKETHGETFPEYGLLPARQQELLDVLGISHPDPTPTIVGISQTDVHVGGKDLCPTVTPTGDFWACHRARRLIGQECLHMQGIFLPPQVSPQFPDVLLRNLAGNSFNTWNVTPCVLALLAVMAECSDEEASSLDWINMMDA